MGCRLRGNTESDTTEAYEAVLHGSKKWENRYYFQVTIVGLIFRWFCIDESNHTNGGLIRINLLGTSFEYVNSIPDNTLE